MLPILIVCHNLTQTAKPSVSAFFRNTVLPTASAQRLPPTDGLHSPPGAADDDATAFYFKHLTFFLTCLDTNVKRYAGEWIFLLCNENGASLLEWLLRTKACELTLTLVTWEVATAHKYTQRTELGNAIGLLRAKGFA